MENDYFKPWNYCNIHWHDYVFPTCRMARDYILFFKTLGMPTTPLSMLLIGSIVAGGHKKALEMCKDKYIWIVVL